MAAWNVSPFKREAVRYACLVHASCLESQRNIPVRSTWKTHSRLPTYSDLVILYIPDKKVMVWATNTPNCEFSVPLGYEHRQGWR